MRDNHRCIFDKKQNKKQGADLGGGGACVCLWMLSVQSIYSFPQVQFMLGTWGYFKRINKNYICGYLLGGSVCVCVCCHCVTVHQSIQPCLQSLISVIYSQAEQGHAFETAPGEQIKGKGSSSSSWKISTPGTVTHTYSPDTILIWVHTQLSSWLRGFILSFAQMRISPLHNQSGQPPDAVTSVCVCVEVCLRVCLLHSITWATGPCNTSVPEDNFYFLASQSCLQHKQEPQKVIFSARCLIRQPGCRGRSLSVSIKAVVSR